MKNPLRHRYVRELISDKGKYLVIFLLLFMTISLASGYYVAIFSMISAYDNSFETYNIEDGKFTSENRINKSQKASIEEGGDVYIYENYYVDKLVDNGSTLRLYKNREEVDLVCVMEGRLPETNNEISIDRMYAHNNEIGIGDTLNIEGQTYNIVGLVSLSDYSALYANNNDSMFDAVKFGVAVITDEQFSSFDKNDLVYCYSWKYRNVPSDIIEENKWANDFLDVLNKEIVLKDYVPQYINQAIVFAGNDLGNDKAMIDVLLYIIIVIVAFVFAVTMSNTITQESSIIGTLRASGYSKLELVKHYMFLPIAVSITGCVLGNVVGYTYMKEVMANLYYNSYSLPSYITLWNTDAFIKTTIIPLLIMLVVNSVILFNKLSFTPLQFLKKNLTRNRKKKAIKLPYIIPFFKRFRIRIGFQNISNYLTMAIGIFFANFLLLFGLSMPVVITNYTTNIKYNMISKYQYILSAPSNMNNKDRKLESLINGLTFLNAVETSNEDAEKFSAYTLDTLGEDGALKEEVMIYGIKDNSAYVSLELDNDDVYISRSFSDKYGVEVGEEVTLKEQYENKNYTFKVTGIYDYEGSISMFMRQEKVNELFELGKGSFAGYFSNSEITDIDERFVGSVIDEETLTTLSRQLMVSMGDLMKYVNVFSLAIFMVLMYLLSKTIIEKNAQSISMTKILGYKDSEIGRLYIVVTLIVVIVSILVSIPVVAILLRYMFIKIIMSSMSGWLRFIVGKWIFVEMFLLGLGAYLLVAILEFRKIRKVPMSEALKNVE